MSRCYSLMILFCFFSFGLHAQKKGKPNLKRYKRVLRKAKRGDAKSSLKIARVYKGHVLASDAVKDYSNAKKWYLNAVSKDFDPRGKASFGMFIISLTGGYGTKSDMKQAKIWHQKTIKNGAFQNNKTYMPALDLADFFQVYDSAKSGSVYAKLQLARMYFEFGINYRKARKWLKPLVELQDQEAIYLNEKWKAARNRYHSYREAKVHNPVLFYLLEKHAKAGSMIAKLEWIEVARTTGDRRYHLSKKEVMKILEDFKTDIPELQFKMLFIRQQYESGIKKYATLRQMSTLKHGLSESQLQFAQGALQEFAMIDSKLKTISDLGNMFRQSDTMNEVKFDVVAYHNHFEGYIRPLVAIQKQISTPNMQAFLGKNYKILKNELNDKVKKVMDVASDSPMLLMTIREGFHKSVWLRGIYYPHNHAILAKKLSKLGITKENMPLYEEMHQLERVKFKGLSEARNYLYKIDTKDIRPEDKMTLKSYIRTKGIRDIIGLHPDLETIERNKYFLLNTAWLQPEGAKEYFRYTSDSENWFSGDIQKLGVNYHYIVKIRPSGRYKLIINSVRGNYSNLVYSSNIEIADQKQYDRYMVKLYLSEYTGYQWKQNLFDYLRVTYPATGKEFVSQTVGNKLKRKQSGADRKNEAVLTQKARKGSFSKKTAIRSTVEYFIHKYTKALRRI